jgi:exopolysaccharide biosynthesis polyprenyl glycosylphosphotransferase
MRFGRLRALVTAVQLACVLGAELIVFGLVRFRGGLDTPLLETPGAPLTFTALFTLLWMAQLFFLWNPSEFTSNRNLFRPTSIGKSSVVVSLAFLILSGLEQNGTLLAFGLFFVLTGTTLLLIGYGAIRYTVRKSGNQTWLSSKLTVVSESSDLTKLAGLLGRPLANESISIPSAMETEPDTALAMPAEQLVGAKKNRAEHHGDAVVVSPDHGLSSNHLQELLRNYQRSGIDSLVVTSLGSESAGRVDVLLLQESTVLVIRGSKQNKWFRFTKRLIDIILAGAALIVLSPLMLAIAFAIRIDSPGGAIFLSERAGKDGKPFILYKFRTMRNGSHAEHEELYRQRPELANGGIFKIVDDPRITRFGAFLRRSSLDELPQFWNVLLGDMSLVGPRPLHDVEVLHFNGRAAERMRVLPGLSGLWQVNGRSLLSWEETVELDLLYVSQQSIWLDLTILARTIPVVLSRKGAF